MTNLSGANLNNGAAVGLQGESMESPSTFTAYPACKDSGVEWMGEVPLHWQIKALRYLSVCLDGKRIPLNGEQRADKQGDIPYWGANAIMDYVDEAIFDEELLLVGEDGAPFLDPIKPVAFHSSGPVWPNNHIHVLRPNKPEWVRFLVYAMNAADYANYIEGSTRQKLNQSRLMGMPVSWPGYTEQTQIARFLDHETARIDALIEEQQRLIELLKEKRQSVISHAVTKGLDPTVPMKDSGVEWLGEVPAHWRSLKVKRLFTQSKRQGYADMEVLSVYRDYGVVQKNSRDDNNNKTPEDLSLYQLVMEGDLVVNKMKAWQGSLGVSEYQGITSPDYVVYSPSHGEMPRFIHYLLRASHMPRVYLSISNGIRPSQWRIEPEKFEQVEVFLPGKAEQLEIVAYLEAQIIKVNELILCCEQAIELFSERRSALISAAVTGKIDVRGWRPATEKSAQHCKILEA